MRCQLEEKSVSAALALGFCTQLVVQPVTAYKCQASPSSPVSFSASREVGRRPLLLLFFSSPFLFPTTMRTFLLIVAVSLASSANVKREAAPDAEATAEADASADPGYARHHGHAGVTLLTETCWLLQIPPSLSCRLCTGSRVHGDSCEGVRSTPGGAPKEGETDVKM